MKRNNCNLNLKAILFDKFGNDIRPEKCRNSDTVSGTEKEEQTYMIVAQCVPPPIIIPFLDNREVKLDEVAFVCVASDLLIVFVMYVSLLLLETF